MKLVLESALAPELWRQDPAAVAAAEQQPVQAGTDPELELALELALAPVQVSEGGVMSEEESGMAESQQPGPVAP